MKWPAWINSQTRSGTLNLTKELLSKNITVRSHNLVWPECGNGHVPDQFCQVLDKNKTAFENVVHDHIVNETQTLNSIGCCEEYDVVNEPYSNTNVLQKLQQGNYPLKLWVNTAASSAATAGRRINDDQLCTGVKAIVGSKGDFYRDLIPSLLANGTKLTGMGCESHVGTLLPGMESILSWFDYFHSLGLNVRVTEFDMQVANETLAAEFMRDFLIAAYSHPAVDGFLMWGFVDRWALNYYLPWLTLLVDSCHWKRNAPLFREDWTPKPAHDVWQALVLGAWRSRSNGATDAYGDWTSEPLHLGTYNFTVYCPKGPVTVVGHAGSNQHVRC